MIVPVNVEGKTCLALAVPSMLSRADFKLLRNAMLDVIETCLISEENKECTESRSFITLLSVVRELNRDLEVKLHGE